MKGGVGAPPPADRLPRLGLHLSNHGSAASYVGLARAAEAGGLDSLWISEDLYFRGAMPIAGAVAAVTTTIPIGFGVLTPYSRHASLLAMELAALVDIAGPRVIAGFGAGVKARTEAMAVEYASPLVAVRETVEIVRALLAGESVTRHGRTQRLQDLRLSFEDRPPVPPVYVAAVGPQALEQAGAIADGVVLSLLSCRRYVRWSVERIRAGAAAAGRTTDLPAVAYIPFAIDAGGGKAVASLKPTIAYYLQRWAPIPSLRRLFCGLGPLSEAELERMADALGRGVAPESVVPDELVLEYCVAGTPGQCRVQLASWFEAGVSDVAAEAPGEGGVRAELVRSLVALRAPGGDPAAAGEVTR